MPRKKDPVRSAVSHYASACHYTPHDTQRLAELRRDINVAKLIRDIEYLLAESPTPTQDQRRHIAGLLLAVNP